VLGLGSNGSLTLKDYYAGNVPVIVYSDGVDTGLFLSINDVSVTEGNSGTKNASFTVTLSRASSLTVTVNYTTAATVDGTATAGSDYTAKTGTLTFAPGVVSQMIEIPIFGDTLSEANETFFVNLSGATNADIADSQGIGTIQNDDFNLSINDVSLTEGNSGTKNASFTVTLSQPNSQIVTVNYATADGTAIAGIDYTATSGTLTFAAGITSQMISIPVIGDTLSESNETFTVNLSGATNANIADNQGIGTIQNDDSYLSINDISLTEGNSGTTNATFTVSLSQASTQTVSVNYATADGTATTGNKDYTAKTGTLTFAPGVTSQTVSVAVTGDTVAEYDEQFYLNLNTPTNATITDSQGIGTIVNNDPGLIINDIQIQEGSSGTTNAVFTVTLTGTTTNTVSVTYATANGTGTSGSDYTSTTGSLSFAPGTTSKTISVPVIGDAVVESNETFFVNLSSARNATLLDAQGSSTIVDDDRKLNINDISIIEGDSGTKNASFNVSLSSPSSQVVTVNYATANGTAMAGSDYTAVTGTLTFAANQTSQSIIVPILGDTLSEGNENFLVNLSNASSGVSIADGQGAGTIVDDEPVFSINDVSITEGNSGTTNAAFSVSLSKASSQIVTVNYATADGTATAGNDYVAGSGTLTFAAGETSKTINVAVIGDTLPEANETFSVNLSNASGVSITDSQGIGTILDDEPRISLNDVSVTEGNSGTANANFTITLSGASSQPVTLNYATADGTATAGSDYTATTGTLTFAAGATSQTIAVPVFGDTLSEASETFFLNLSSTTNAGIADSQGVGTIVNDDAIQIAINDVSVTEGNSGTKNASFTVSLDRPSNQIITIKYATADGTATTGNRDYTATTGTLTFAAGVTSQTINVAMTGDTVGEYDEKFYVNLNTPTNAIIADSQGVGTIVNDDPTLIINDVQIQEGPSGTTTNGSFTVTLTAPSTNTVSVTYATANGTAVSGTDYTAVKGTLSFSPGQTSKTITVPVLGDSVVESNETFFVNLSSARNATLLDAQGIVTILNYSANGSVPVGNIGISSINGTDEPDILQGTENDDQLAGLGGSDALSAGGGADLLIAANPNSIASGQGEIDTLTGGLGLDLFVLGDALQAYYNDGNEADGGYGDYGLIVDFNANQGDLIQLHGLAADYTFVTSPAGLPSGTAIFLHDELVGIIQDVAPTSIPSNGISCVTFPLANADAAITQQNTAVNISVLANDRDAWGIDSFSQGTQGSVTLNNNGTPSNSRDDFLTYTPNTGFSGSDSFSYTISDGNGGTDTATVSVAVQSPFSEVFDWATGKFKLGESLNFTAFALANNPSGNSFSMNNSLTTVNGTIALGSGAQQSFSGSPQVTGDYFSDPLAKSVNPAQVNLTGSGIQTALNQAETDVENLAAKAIALTPTQTFSKLVGGETISAASLGADSPSYNIIRIPNIDLSGSKTVTIRGEADDFFLIQLFDPAPGSKLASLKMSGTSQIVLSGGLKPDNLLWYVEGQVTMSGSAIARGNFLAFDPENQFVDDVYLNGAAIEGQIFANSLNLTGGARVTGVAVKTIYGTANADALNGTSDNDGIFGRAGDDNLTGLAGSDWLEGGSGSDQLEGNDGNDVLLGGTGNDNLLGGAGSDTFVLASGEGTDTIGDFVQGMDIIGLSGGLSFSNLNFSGSDILFGSQVLATVPGMDATTLTASDFLGF
jgi:Ca2+-binding RTX toxin-like protein